MREAHGLDLWPTQMAQEPGQSYPETSAVMRSAGGNSARSTPMEPLVDITENIHIDADTEQVWSLVSDVERHAQYAGPKSITKQIEFQGDLVPGARWVAHEKFGPQKFDAPSEITEVNPGQRLAWVSFPPMKEANRGAGGRVHWSYSIEPDEHGTRLTHHMQVMPPEKGAWVLKAMYAVLRLPSQQRRGIHTSLTNIKAAAEAPPTPV
jgi:uncharacterized protein YndB with AHSA1/START domain